MRKLLLFLFLCFCSLLHAEKYLLSGTIYDDESESTVLPGARVHVVVNNKVDTTIIADSLGRYSVSVPDSCSLYVNEFDDFLTPPFNSIDITPKEIKKLSKKKYNLYLYPVDVDYLVWELYCYQSRPIGLKSTAITPVKTLTISDITGIDAANVGDVLEQVLPGVEFSMGMNGTPVMNMQGMGGKDVLFLVDGEKMAGETMDNIDYDRLDMNNVKRIDVYKGASTAMYGSSAIGGVVDIITPTPSFNTGIASINYRNHNDLRANASAELVSHEKFVGSLTSFSFHNRDTYTLQGTDKSSSPVTIWGIKNININEKINVGLGRNRDKVLAFKGGYYRETIDKSSYQGYNYFHQGANAGVRGNFALNKFLNLKSSYYFDRYVKDYKYVDYDLPDKRKYENNRHNAKLMLEYSKVNNRLGNTLSAGANYEYEYLLSDQFEFDLESLIEEALKNQGITTDDYYYEIIGTPYKVHRQKTLNSFVSHNLQLKTIDFDLLYGLGLESHSEYGTNVCPNIGVKKSLKAAPITFRANYTKGMRNPNLKERYTDYDVGGLGMFRIVGNSDLTTEKSNNFSLSVNYDIPAENKNFFANIFVNGFYHNKKNCIEGQFNARKDTMKYINVGEVQLYGFDACITMSLLKHWFIDLNYTFLQDSYSNVTFTTNRPHSGTAKFTYKKTYSDNYSLTASLNGTIKGKNDSESVAYDSNTGQMVVDKTQTYPAYSVWKLNTTHRIGKRRNIELNFGIDNIFNYKPKTYDLVSCQSDGISVYGGIKFTFEE